MGTTNLLGLPWPNVTDKVKDGATAIRQLAEAVENTLRCPLLVTNGAGELTWSLKVAEVPWDVTDNPSRKRGTWDSFGSNERLVVPATPGYYFVSASVRFGGKAEPDSYQLGINTRTQADQVGTGTTWAQTRIELPANSSTYSQLSVASVVRLDVGQGIAVRLQYDGSTQPPSVGEGVNKLRIHWMSPL